MQTIVVTMKQLEVNKWVIILLLPKSILETMPCTRPWIFHRESCQWTKKLLVHVIHTAMLVLLSTWMNISFQNHFRSSKTIFNLFATLVPSCVVVYMHQLLPFQMVSLMIRCYPPGFTFMAFTSRASSAIAAWQLLWSNTQTSHQPLSFRYLISAISIARCIWAMNLSRVQILIN